MLQDLPGIINIADDIIVYGRNTKEHDERLLSLMIRSEKYGLVFNAEKCTIGTNEITFFGLIYNQHGISSDPERCEAIMNLQAPTNVTTLRSFLGIANYMSQFTPNLATLLEPLRYLTHKDTSFSWTPSHGESFKTIKDAISKQVTLSYFITNAPTIIQVDASGTGLGAVLMQNYKPIYYASRPLLDTETRYANIERELLAVVYGCKRFHHFVFGKEFTIESDHKPLEMIILKHIATAPPRLQRMLLKLQR